ncbi:MAG: hypothetical protein AAF604_15295 [Acidobacteriota bacterium]
MLRPTSPLTLVTLCVVFILASVGSALATSIPVAEKPQEEEPRAPGRLAGSAYAVGNAAWDGALVIEVISAEGLFAASAASDADGAYAVPSLAEGHYVVVAKDAASGASASYQVDIASGLETRLNFIHDDRRSDSLIAAPAAFILRDGDPSPDPMRDGVVDLRDLEFVRSERGAVTDKPTDDADLNDDGRVDDQDIAIVRSSFGRAALTLGTPFSADVQPGGSVCTLANGAIEIRSLAGHTTGSLVELEGGVVRLVVSDDSGVATSEQLGAMTFDDDPAAPSFIDVSLADGRVVGGEIGLNVDLDAYPETLVGSGKVAGGYVAFRPGGFERYRLTGIEGSLAVGATTVAYACDEGNDKKEDKACETKQEPRGSALCSFGGTACKTDGADCAKNGGCKTCRNAIVTYYHPNDPTRPIGKSCNGCSCF